MEFNSLEGVGYSRSGSDPRQIGDPNLPQANPCKKLYALNFRTSKAMAIFHTEFGYPFYYAVPIEIA